ncbi:FAD-dependent monooxygenase [Micromonospora sp. NPDC049204]|uniref:FAD-dependent monooxygenase n=1 Tax=unclassified Micromonospora TaxID=2617518 RepID=UPI00340557E9
MDASVIVVGAGPAGLALAGELRLAGADVVVLDRLTARSGESRGLGFTVRTLETFDQRGLLPRFPQLPTTTRGHFGGIPLDLAVLGGQASAVQGVPQSVTEKVLEEWVRDLGGDIRFGHEMLDLEQDEDAVQVRVRTAGGEQHLRARYLIGADGGRSRVRERAGIAFPGTEPTTELLLADIRGADITPRMTGEVLATGMVMAAPLGDGIDRVIICERGAEPRRRTAPPLFSEVAEAWKRLTGTDISHAEAIWVSAFTDTARLAEQYRRGRVLLTGDAAHVHLPAGGQGMNTSIQDAVNLGWKLAAVLRGTAPESLLDTYHTERHEVGRQLLANTQAQARLILGGDEAQPFRDVLTELMAHEPVRRHLAAKVSGLDIRYDVGGGTHPLLGARLPRLSVLARDRPADTAALLRPGRGVLLDLNDNPWLRRRAAGWRDRVDIVTTSPRDPQSLAALAGATAVLVRPDGYVAWAAPGTRYDLPTALNRWFGPARARSEEK